MADNELISIEVAYALPNEQTLLKIDVPTGTTIEKAIEVSGILIRYPQINLSKDKVGIFSKVSNLDSIVKNNDRIEIYRSLQIDPKESRRRLAEMQRRQQQQ